MDAVQRLEMLDFMPVFQGMPLMPLPMLSIRGPSAVKRS